MSFNKIILVGNLGRDPELRYTPDGTTICNFSLATNERRRDPKTGENNDVTTWFRVTLWRRQAEVASQYLSRGKPVYIEGRLRVEEYTDRDGKLRHTLEVTDRKSTRLNSSHVSISYAVFCLKKKKKN